LDLGERELRRAPDPGLIELDVSIGRRA
jgi:hypothetical protein